MPRIIRPQDVIECESVAMLIYGYPGAGKSALAQTASKPFTLDFDSGIHRVFNRRLAVRFNSWQEVLERETQEAIHSCETIVVDTVGRMLDLMSVFVLTTDTKNRTKGGAMSIQGWGALKTLFGQWVAQARLLKKHIVFIAHEKAERSDGDSVEHRPDIQGGSYAEVMKSVDFVGSIRHVPGVGRVLNFSPEDSWVGKNAAGFQPTTLPDLAKNENFLALIINEAKARMGQIAMDVAQTAAEVEKWAKLIADMKPDPEAFDAQITVIATLPKVVATQIKPLLASRMRQLEIEYNRDTKRCYRKPVAPAELPTDDFPVAAN